MDDADRAQPEVERGLAEALRTRRREGPPPTGECLWCDEPVEAPKRWCGSDCRDQWEAHRR